MPARPRPASPGDADFIPSEPETTVKNGAQAGWPAARIAKAFATLGPVIGLSREMRWKSREQRATQPLDIDAGLALLSPVPLLVSRVKPWAQPVDAPTTSVDAARHICPGQRPHLTWHPTPHVEQVFEGA
jgi:hypothetical protein